MKVLQMKRINLVTAVPWAGEVGWVCQCHLSPAISWSTRCTQQLMTTSHCEAHTAGTAGWHGVD